MFDTKNNHYVPKAYLENFSTEDLHKLVKKQLKTYYVNNLSSECSKLNLCTTKKKISNNMVLLVAKTFKLNKLELNLLSQLQSYINKKELPFTLSVISRIVEFAPFFLWL